MKPLFLLFASRDNEDSWKYSKDWILLSSIAYKQYTIARTDCQFDYEVCNKWEITSYPFVLFFKNNMIFKYTGSLSIETTMKYLSLENYKSAEYAIVYHENLFEYVSHMDGSFDFVARIRRMSDDLTNWSQEKSNNLFEHIRLYHWSPQAKLLMFVLTVLGIPSVIFTYFMIYAFIWSKKQLSEILFSTKPPRNGAK